MVWVLKIRDTGTLSLQENKHPVFSSETYLLYLIFNDFQTT